MKFESGNFFFLSEKSLIVDCRWKSCQNTLEATVVAILHIMEAIRVMTLIRVMTMTHIAHLRIAVQNAM